MNSTMLPAGRKAGRGGDTPRPDTHISATRRFIDSVVEFVDGRPFDTDADARSLRTQAAALAKLLPPPPPPDLQPLAEACAVAAGAVTRFTDASLDFDHGLRWVEHIPGDLCGVEHLLDEIADHLPPVPGELRRKRTYSDRSGTPTERLAAMLAVLGHVEEMADDATESLPHDCPLNHKLQTLAWAIRAGTNCLHGEVFPEQVKAVRSWIAAEGL